MGTSERATERVSSTPPEGGVLVYEELHPSQWSKLERIQFLLDRWDEIFDPSVTSPAVGVAGGGSGIPLLPQMARHSSVVELARCLEALRQERPALYQHLKFYRCNCEWRQVRAMIRVRLTSGRWDEIPGWKRERIVPRWISLSYVSRAEEFLASVFRGEVFIPKELWDGLTRPIAQSQS